MNGRVDRSRQRRLTFFRRLASACFFSCGLGALVASCHAATEVQTEEDVQVEVRQVGFDQRSNSPVVILQDAGGKKAMPIWVGVAEAQAIALELEGIPPPRPLTHDLLKNILDQVGVRFEKVVVSELKGSTYYARIYLATASGRLEVDSRPSDAIALALRFHRPIFVAKGVFDAVLVPDAREVRAEAASTKVAGLAIQNLTADLASYFHVANTEGVLVADAGDAAGEDHLQRGDVIVAVGEEKIHGVDDFQTKLDKTKGRGAILRVQRQGREVGVYFVVQD